MKPLAPLLAALVLAAPLFAGDDPHGNAYIGAYGSSTSVNGTCAKCHATHKAAGTDLSAAISNESLCTSCHNLGGIAASYPLERFVKADPVNQLGTSHAWNAPAENSAAGAATPSNALLAAHLSNGNVTCSTCHDEHHGADPAAVAAGTAGQQFLGAATRVAGSGTGTVTYTAAPDASSRSSRAPAPPAPRSSACRMTAASPGSARARGLG